MVHKNSKATAGGVPGDASTRRAVVKDEGASAAERTAKKEMRRSFSPARASPGGGSPMTADRGVPGDASPRRAVVKVEGASAAERTAKKEMRRSFSPARASPGGGSPMTADRGVPGDASPRRAVVKVEGASAAERTAKKETLHISRSLSPVADPTTTADGGETLKKRSLFELERDWPLRDFVYLQELGRGGFGIVRKVREISSGREYALKVLDKAKLIKEEMLSFAEREIECHLPMDNENILCMRNWYHDSHRIYLLMDLAVTDMREIIHYNAPLGAELCAKYMKELFLGLRYSHANKIAHRDIKPENLLIGFDGQLKISDFGISVRSSLPRSTTAGSIEYLPPEIVSLSLHSFPIDLYAAGIVLFEMSTRKHPFDGLSQKETIEQIKSNSYLIPGSVDRDARDLIIRLVQYSPDKRLTAEEALHHTFIKKHFANFTIPDIVINNLPEHASPQLSLVEQRIRELRRHE